MSRKVILYIAMSLDGYIAAENDDIGFLSSVEVPGEDYGYSDFIRSVDTVIMGRKTYDKVLSFGIEFPHKGKKCYVLSRSKTGEDENVTFFNGDLPALIEGLKFDKGGHIFCDGGAETVFELMRHKLVDRYVVSVIPYFVGKGVRLFREGIPSGQLHLKHSATFPSGLVQLCYEPPAPGK